jgi:hypothetical protein
MERKNIHKTIKKATARFWIFAFTAFISCHSNSIYFDIERQSIVRCNGTLTNFYLKSKDPLETLHFRAISGKKSTDSFYLWRIDTNYRLRVNRQIDLNNNFKLHPNTEYLIMNDSNGDAASGEIIIKTGENGKVIYSSKTSCE